MSNTSPQSQSPTSQHPSQRSSLSSRRAFLPFSKHPLFDNVKLDNILSGQTCPPISFNEYTTFVNNYELTTENFLFVVWYQSYLQRWNEVDLVTRRRVPLPSRRMRDRYAPFEPLEKEMAKRRDEHARSSVNITGVHVRTGTPSKSTTHLGVSGGNGISVSVNMVASSSKATTQSGSSETDLLHPQHSANTDKIGNTSSIAGQNRLADPPDPPQPPQPTHIIHPSFDPALPPPDLEFLAPAEQPMREEALRAYATFLSKGGSRELGISDELRQFARTCIARSSAPESFQEIYEEVYRNINEQSIPQFIKHASENVNRPKQMFWYYVGCGDFAFGLITYMLLTLFLPTHNFGYRAIRLPSVIFTSFGSMQVYSAKRHFCSQVWGRYSRQVKPWEMDDPESDIGADSSNTAQAGRDAAGGQQSAGTLLYASGPGGEADGGPDESKLDLVGSSANMGARTTEDLFSPQSLFSENIFTPTSDRDGGQKYPPISPDMDLHLNDMSGYGLGLDPAVPLDDDFSPPPSASVGTKILTHTAGAEVFSTISPEAHRTDSDELPNPAGVGAGVEGEDGLTDIQRRQLAIRRATIKIPDASLAFPIDEDQELSSAAASYRTGSMPGLPVATRKASAQSYTTAQSTRSKASPLGSPIPTQHSRVSIMSTSHDVSRQKLSEISPFDYQFGPGFGVGEDEDGGDEGGDRLDPLRGPHRSRGRMNGQYDHSEPSSAETPSPQSPYHSHSYAHVDSRTNSNSKSSSKIKSESTDLMALMAKFKPRPRPRHPTRAHSSPYSPYPPHPDEAQAQQSQSPYGQGQGQDRKIPVFGPEKVVEDPLLKAFFESVVRDILVVGVAVGVVWVVLCFAVPCVGILNR